MDGMAFIYDEDSNVGGFLETSEQEEIKTENTFIGNQKTTRVKKWVNPFRFLQKRLRLTKSVNVNELVHRLEYACAQQKTVPQWCVLMGTRQMVLTLRPQTDRISLPILTRLLKMAQR